MTLIQVLLVVLYLFLIVRNIKCYKDGKVTATLTFLTALLSTFLLFATNSADLDWNETQLDMSGYRTVYETYNVLEHPDFNMYYIFYSSMYWGQNMGMSFRLWWALMSIFAMLLVFLSCKIHKYSFTLFLVIFMAYYEFTFYSGLKFFYGLCLYLLAFGFLLHNSVKGKITYAILTCLAGGFHCMYYFFLLFLVKPKRNFRLLIGSILLLTILFTIVLRLSGSAISIMAPFFNSFENEHINVYTSGIVNWGFYIAFILHVIMLYALRKIKLYKLKTGTYTQSFESFYYLGLLSMLFFPFYTVALTFMRFLTSFSIVVMVASSSFLNGSKEERTLCVNMSLFVSISFLLMKLVASIGAPRGFVEVAILPFFDVF